MDKVNYSEKELNLDLVQSFLKQMKTTAERSVDVWSEAAGHISINCSENSSAFNSWCIYSLMKSQPALEEFIELQERDRKTPLEVPLGFFADRYGRIRSTVAGIFLIIVALACIYVALQVESISLKTILIYIDGICLGLAKPLISGSMDAFYEDSIRYHAGTDPELLSEISSSFTKSAQFGKYIPLFAISAAIALLYVFEKFWQIEHVFLIGILLYFILVIQVGIDAKFLGDRRQEPKVGVVKNLLPIFYHSRRAQYAVFLRVSFFMLGVVIAGYMIITVLRHLNHDTGYFWPILMAYAGGQAVASIVRGYFLSRFQDLLGESRYINGLLWVQLLSAFGMIALISAGSFWVLVGAVFLYSLLFFVSYGALGLISTDILNPVIPSAYRATALSIFNIPAFIGVGLYSVYLSCYSEGSPAIYEMYWTAGTIALISLFSLSFWNKYHSVEG